MTPTVTCLVIVFLSWAALRIEGKSLRVFGLAPAAARLGQFAVGFLLTAMLAALVSVLRASAAHASWAWNDAFAWSQLFVAAFGTLVLVVREELVFRGYLLYKLCDWFGERTAVLVTAALFGMFHWHVFGQFGDARAMASRFAFMGFQGVMLALCYTRPGSIVPAIGLHWAETSSAEW